MAKKAKKTDQTPDFTPQEVFVVVKHPEKNQFHFTTKEIYLATKQDKNYEWELVYEAGSEEECVFYIDHAKEEK